MIIWGLSLLRKKSESLALAGLLAPIWDRLNCTVDHPSPESHTLFLEYPYICIWSYSSLGCLGRELNICSLFCFCFFSYHRNAMASHRALRAYSQGDLRCPMLPAAMEACRGFQIAGRSHNLIIPWIIIFDFFFFSYCTPNITLVDDLRSYKGFV